MAESVHSGVGGATEVHNTLPCSLTDILPFSGPSLARLCFGPPTVTTLMVYVPERSGCVRLYMEIQTDRQTDRQADRQTTDRQTD